MKLLKTITNKDFGIGEATTDGKLFLREAARAVILNANSEVAVIEVIKGGYHKIPGGGIEDGEDVVVALKREAQEEAGVEIEVVCEIGKILEYREGLKQYSYCYLARVVGEIGESKLEESEKAEGFQKPKWLHIDEAIKLFDNDAPTFLRAQFMGLRDGIFVKEAKKYIK